MAWVHHLALGAFNMIPGFPLDGGRVLHAILWWAMDDAERSTRAAAIVGQIIAVFFIGFGVLRFFQEQVWVDSGSRLSAGFFYSCRRHVHAGEIPYAFARHEREGCDVYRQLHSRPRTFIAGVRSRAPAALRSALLSGDPRWSLDWRDNAE